MYPPPPAGGPTTTWADCSVGVDPSTKGGDIQWVEKVQLPSPCSPSLQGLGPLQQLALGPTGDIALGVLCNRNNYNDWDAMVGRLNGSGALFLVEDYDVWGQGASIGVNWGSLSITSSNDLLTSVVGSSDCPSYSPSSGPGYQCPDLVGGFTQPLTPPGGQGMMPGSLMCAAPVNGPGSYCLVSVSQAIAPGGQLDPWPAGVPDGTGGTYVSGGLSSTLDLGCGKMVATSSSNGYVAHLGPGSSCIYSHVLPAVPEVVADAKGAVLRVSSTTGLDLGCGALAAAPGGSTFVTRLDPAGGCVFGKSLPAPGLTVVLDPAGSAVVSGLVGATSVDLGGGPLAPRGSQDVVIAELDASGNPLWSKRLGGPGITFDGPWVSASAAGNVVLRTGFGGSVDLGGGPVTAAKGDTVVASYAASGAHRWSRDFPIRVGPGEQYMAGIDGCGALVAASTSTTFDPGAGIVPPVGTTVWQPVAVVRFAP